MDEQPPNMKQQEAIQLFEEKKVRTIWNQDEEKWYFSIVDTVSLLKLTVLIQESIGVY